MNKLVITIIISLMALNTAICQDNCIYSKSTKKILIKAQKKKEKGMKLKTNLKAASLFEKALSNNPKCEAIKLALAETYMAIAIDNGQFHKASFYLDKIYEFSDNTVYLQIADELWVEFEHIYEEFMRRNDGLKQQYRNEKRVIDYNFEKTWSVGSSYTGGDPDWYAINAGIKVRKELNKFLKKKGFR